MHPIHHHRTTTAVRTYHAPTIQPAPTRLVRLPRRLDMRDMERDMVRTAFCIRSKDGADEDGIHTC